MLKLKRALVLILSLAMLLTVALTGCGQNAGNTAATQESTTAATSAAEQTTAEPALPEVMLTWYVLTNSQPDDALVYGEANKYLKEKLNATVEFFPLNMGEYNDKIKVKLAGGDPIDVVFTSSWLNSYIDNVAKGALLPIDDLLNQYGTELKAVIPQKYWDMCMMKKDGDDKAKLYGVPNYQIEVNVEGLAFRKDLAEKYNLVDAINNVKTYDDLTPIFKTIKDNEPDVAPLIDGNIRNKYDLTAAPYNFEPTANYMLDIDTSTFKVLALDEPQKMEAEMKLSKIRRDWYQKAYIHKDALTIKDREPYKKQGKVFCYTLGACKPGVEIEEKGKYGFDIIAKQVMAPVTSVGQVTATMNAIPISSKNPERAMMLLNLVNTDKYLYNLLNFGVENTHYKKIDDNTIEITPDSKFNPQMAWALGCQFNAFIQKGQAPDVWEQTKKLNESAVTSPIEGFSFNSEPVKTEMAQMQAVGDKYDGILKQGAADPEAVIAKRNKEMNNNNNMKKVADEVQKQLDEWKAAHGK
jgi:putative aldouronate transport system substrate-binding protein